MTKTIFSPELRLHMRTFGTLVPSSGGSPAQYPFCSVLGKAFPTQRPFRFDWRCRWVSTKGVPTLFLKEKTLAFDVAQPPKYSWQPCLLPISSSFCLPSFSCSLMVRQVFCFPHCPPVSLTSLPGLSHTWAEEHVAPLHLCPRAPQGAFQTQPFKIGMAGCFCVGKHVSMLGQVPEYLL